MKEDLVDLIRGTAEYILSDVNCNCYLGLNDTSNVEWTEKEIGKIITISKNYKR